MANSRFSLESDNLEFKTLSSDVIYTIHKKATIDEVRKAVAEKLNTEYWLVDVVNMTDFFLYDPETKTEGIPCPINVMVQPESRTVPCHMVSQKPDITWEQEYDPRVEMPCGHAITPDNLCTFVRKELALAKFELRCFGKTNNTECNKVWDFQEVLKKLMPSEDERIYFEGKISFNFINRSGNNDIKFCPRCELFCQRENQFTTHAKCLKCTKDLRSTYKFCWLCLETFCPGHVCGNESDIKSLQEITSKLQKCTTTTMEYSNMRGVPTIRLCPSCRTLLEHDQACKTMHCQFCNTEFCFACLAVAKDGKLTCGDFNTRCFVAPIQTLN